MRGSQFIDSLPATASVQRENMIIQAVKDGNAVIDWCTIVSEEGDNKLELVVSKHVLKIGDCEDAVRVAVTCRTMQLLCDELDCVMPTAKISDLCWLQAANQLPAYTQTPDSHMSDTDRFVTHSEAIDKGLDGRTGLSAPEGKDFVLTNRLWSNTSKSANYGWQVKGAPSRGAIPGVQVWQPVGLAHIVDFTDYSQMFRLIKRRALLNGEEVDLADIYISKELAVLVSSEGALPGYRHPGIALSTGDTELPPSEDDPPGLIDGSGDETLPTLRMGDKGDYVVRWQSSLVTNGYSLDPYGTDGDFGKGTDKQTKEFQSANGLTVDGVVGPATWAALDGEVAPPLAEAAEAPPDGPLPWRDPSLTVGQRAVLFAISEKDDGVKEEPNGSNNGPRIKQYLKRCVRDSAPGLGAYLAKAGGNWCAAFFWFCQHIVTFDEDGEEQYPYRCSGLEMENDAKKRGAWRPVSLVLSGEWEPAEGDGVIYKSGTKAWRRHVCRYIKRTDSDNFKTVGGNEGNTIKVTPRRFDHPKLLGFVEFPRETPTDYLACDERCEDERAIDDQKDGEVKGVEI